ncbi:Uncharacterised protein [Actinomyces bovis]|uniref:Alpha/beta hydrolase family n=1 Tax=Actinomyces bovis TaxID=1658 RepID=A0ABY1VQP9_9ACTO|nr:hypothetical protein [Actinomyces bovis]SPT54449.1 Uncharacterised protein [Actinomyces bovis]VEG55940.1 Uncharacterised protein [Actinomyces israelii]
MSTTAQLGTEARPPTPTSPSQPWAMGTGPGSNNWSSRSADPQPAQADPSSKDSDNGLLPSPAAHHWTWTWPGGGAGVVVTGGSTAANTDDLRQLANAISCASSRLSSAGKHAKTALGQVQDVEIPNPQPIPSNPFANYPACPVTFANSSSTAAKTGPDPEQVRRLRNNAEADLKLARDGDRHTAGITSVSSYLNGLVSDILVCASMYDAADGKANPANGSNLNGPASPVSGGYLGLTGVGPVGWGLLGLGLMPSVLGPVILGIVGPPIQAHLGLALDALQALDLLISDEGTEDWVRNDLVRLVGLGVVAARAKTGREAATVQAEMQHAAERLDPWVKQHLPDKVQVGTQLVDPSTLTPVQRCTAYLALLAAKSGQERYGTNHGVDVSQRPTGPKDETKTKAPTRTVHVPPSTKDPFGLGTPVDPKLNPALEGYQPLEKTPTGTISDTIDRSNTLQTEERRDAETAAISITRIEHADGTKSYRVIIPGTTDWGSGSPAPQDLLTNLQGASGMPTDMESGVVTAMRMAGIQPEDEVSLYGHSQGGITAVNIAADPEVAKHFKVTEVLTAGSPTAHVQLPEEVHALHLENAGDAVPALDGAPSPTGPNRAVVQLDTHEQKTAYPHGAEVYQDTAMSLEQAGEPAVDAWSEHHQRLMGVGAQVAGTGGAAVATTEIIYDIRRRVGDDSPAGSPTPSPQPGPAPRPPSGSGSAKG